MKKITIILLISALLLQLAGCAGRPGAGETTPPVSGGIEPEAKKTVIQQTAWCVYWDPDAASALAENLSRYREIVMFGCVYAEDHSLIVPDALRELISALPDRSASDRPEFYLSFVNDVMHPDNSSTQKSTAFLEEVLPDAELSDAVIDDMIRQALDDGFDGIELDYENIHKCDSLWDAYLGFISRLWLRAASENLKLRVVLSVSTPVTELDFPEGPRYALMCYNLYGNHSGPGPKADEAFLKSTFHKFRSLDTDFALANGGFEWGPTGKALRSLTAKAAAALAAENGAREMRDGDGVLHYTFRSADGMHTVYYGDEETIRGWSEILLKEADGDIRVNLWRLE